MIFWMEFCAIPFGINAEKWTRIASISVCVHLVSCRDSWRVLTMFVKAMRYFPSGKKQKVQQTFFCWNLNETVIKRRICNVKGNSTTPMTSVINYYSFLLCYFPGKTFPASNWICFVATKSKRPMWNTAWSQNYIKV